MKTNLEIISPNSTDPSIEDIDVLLIGGIHGDEPSGIYAIKEMKKNLSSDNLKKTVGLLIANEKAYERDVRYIEEDLNRIFEENIEGDTYEKQLAREIKPMVDQADAVLSLHSTQSFSEPFGMVSKTTSHNIRRALFKLSLSKAVVYPERQHRGGLVSYDNVLEVEAGLQKSESAKINAVNIAREFLYSQYCMDTEREFIDLQWSDCMLYQTTGEIEKHGNTELYVENFTEVPSGKVYAKSQDQEYLSSEAFIPILMSEEGYESVLGYKSKHIGWLSQFDFSD